jgi:hypothetical protein
MDYRPPISLAFLSRSERHKRRAQETALVADLVVRDALRALTAYRGGYPR